MSGGSGSRRLQLRAGLKPGAVERLIATDDGGYLSEEIGLQGDLPSSESDYLQESSESESEDDPPEPPIRRKNSKQASNSNEQQQSSSDSQGTNSCS